MKIRHLLAGALLCFLSLVLLGQTTQPPGGSAPSMGGAQTTPPTFPPGTARDSGQEKSKSSASKNSAKAKSFAGRIAKESTGYCLRSGNLAYKLDDQNQASTYDGQNVRVVGKLDKETNTIQIERIEPQ